MARSISFDILANDRASRELEKVADKAEEVGRRVKEASGTVEIDVDTAKLDATIARLEHKDIKLTAEIGDVERQLAIVNAELKEASGSHKAKLDLDAGELEARLRYLNAYKVQIRAELDGAAKAKAELAEVHSAADRLDGKNVRVKVDVDGGVGALGKLEGLGASFRSLGGLTGPTGLLFGGAGAAQLIGFITSAASGLVGLGAAGVGAGGVLEGALAGVSDAVKALGQQDTGVAGKMRSNAHDVARAIEGVSRAQDALKQATVAVTDAQHDAARAAQDVSRAQDDVKRAQGGVTVAQEGLTDAQRDARVAEDELTDARKKAAERLEDLKRQEEDMRMSQASATLSVLEAEQRLQELLVDPKATDLQRARARLNVSEAEQRQQQLSEDAKKLKTEKADADKKGVEGSDEVKAALARQEQAQRRIEQATRAVADANRAVVDAQRQVVDAQYAHERALRRVAEAEQAVKDRAVDVRDAQWRVQEASQQAGTEGSAAMNKLQQAMKGLSPEAQRFARFLKGLLDGPIQQLRETAQRGLLPGLQAGIQGAFANMPNLNASIGTIAKNMGDFFERIGPHVGKAVDAFARLAALASDKGFKDFGDIIIALLDKFTQWANSKSKDDIERDLGKIKFAFQLAGEMVKVFVGTFKLVGAGVTWFNQHVTLPMVGLLATVSTAFRNMWPQQVGPAWNAMRSGLFTGYTWISTNVFARLSSGVSALGTAFGRARDAIGKAWDGVREKAAAPIRFVINTVIGGVASKFNDLAGKVGIGIRLPVPRAGFARGGPISGPGGGTDDQVPILASAKEWIIRASSAQRLGPKFMQAVNNADIAGDPSTGLIGRYAAGGEVSPAIAARVAPVRSWLPSVDPLPYIWGGVGPGGYDCSGLVGEVWARLTGRPSYRRYMTTNTILDSPGMLGLAPGPGLFTIGVSRTHTAGNLAGLAFEAASTRSGIKIGGAAKSVTSFPSMFHLANLGSAGFQNAGGGGGFSLNPLDWAKSLAGAVLGKLTGGWWNTLGGMGAFGQLGIGVGKKLVGSIFDGGGLLAPGFSLAYNGTGSPEPVLTSGHWDTAAKAVNVAAARGAGGDIHIHVPISNAVIGNEQQTARYIVTTLQSALKSGTVRLPK